LDKRKQYYELFLNIVPKVLGKLNSKRSVERTIHLIMGEYEIDFGKSDDYGKTSLYLTYVTYVILPKVSKKDLGEIINDMNEVELGRLPKRVYLERLNSKVKNNELRWKETLIDVD
jgi:hypothetical protein